MVERPSFDLLDFIAFGSAGILLVLAYVVYTDPIFQFAVWTIILTIYMVWFCYYGVKWLYDIYM